jgi:mannosyltransferase OCH1-like enzyme
MSNFDAHLVDALRYAVLWKTGGIAVDVDMILLQPIDWKNNVITTYFGEMSTKIMKFEPRHPFIHASMQNFANSYNATQREHHGKRIVQEIYEKCGEQSELCANMEKISITNLNFKIEDYFNFSILPVSSHTKLWSLVYLSQ